MSKKSSHPLPVPADRSAWFAQLPPFDCIGRGIRSHRHYLAVARAAIAEQEPGRAATALAAAAVWRQHVAAALSQTRLGVAA